MAVDKKALLIEARERYKKCDEADDTNRRKYRENMKFTYVPGEQWEQAVKNARGVERPCREYNETAVKVKSVVNHMRSNRPMAKFAPTEEGDVQTAEIYEAIWLNTCNQSRFDNIRDSAGEQQVAGGMGAWRVVTDYVEGSVDQQDILIRGIANPLCLHPDYACKEQDKTDARFWFLHTKMPKEEYEAKYPGKDVVAFDSDEIEDDPLFEDDDGVWVAEYWRKEPYQQNLCLLSDGRTIEKTPETVLPTGVTVVKERTVPSHKIVSYILSGDAILEGPTEFAGKLFPFVIAYGEYVVIDGKTYWYGLPERGKDAQRSLNETQTAVFEAVAKAPMEFDWATPEQAAGHLGMWKDAETKNFATKFYNVDPKAPGPPVRAGGIQIPSALMATADMASESMNKVFGVFDTSLENISTGTSGKALNARAAQQNIVTFNFPDNMAKATELTAKIVMGLIPIIIDTPRAIRVLGKDGAEKWVQVNQPDPQTGQVLNDLSRGRYDLTVTQGPNIQTQRQETAEFYQGLMQSLPNQAPLFADVAVKNMDIPGADQVAERLKATLPPNILESINSGQPIDPKAIAMMQQADQAMQLVQQQGAEVQQASQQAQAEQNAASKAKADLQVQAANLKVQEAQLQLQVAQFETQIAQFQAQQATQAAQQQTDDGAQKVEQDRADMAVQLQEALVAIQEQVAQVMEQYAAVQAQCAQQTAQMVGVAVGPKQKTIQLIKVNGAYQGKVTETAADGSQVITDVAIDPRGGQIQGSATPTVQ